MHERYRRQTDGRATAYGEREREFTFAKKATTAVVERSQGQDTCYNATCTQRRIYRHVTSPQLEFRSPLDYAAVGEHTATTLVLNESLCSTAAYNSGRGV